MIDHTRQESPDILMCVTRDGAADLVCSGCLDQAVLERARRGERAALVAEVIDTSERCVYCGRTSQ